MAELLPAYEMPLPQELFNAAKRGPGGLAEYINDPRRAGTPTYATVEDNWEIIKRVKRGEEPPQTQGDGTARPLLNAYDVDKWEKHLKVRAQIMSIINSIITKLRVEQEHRLYLERLALENSLLETRLENERLRAIVAPSVQPGEEDTHSVGEAEGND